MLDRSHGHNETEHDTRSPFARYQQVFATQARGTMSRVAIVSKDLNLRVLPLSGHLKRDQQKAQSWLEGHTAGPLSLHCLPDTRFA